jgi:hypothetical protein
MNHNKRPISVTILACVYLLVGAAGFIFHFKESLASPRDGALIELTELIALVCGIFLLRGANWARWLALVWMLFHVAISFPQIQKVMVHTVICALIAWILLRPEASRYFRRVPIEPA